MDFVSDTLIALFNPGDSQVNVSMPVIMDHIFEPTEFLVFNMTVSDEFININRKPLIKSGLNNIAEGEIIDSNSMYNSMINLYKLHNYS